MAQTALKIKEDLTFSDSEIDVFLPRQLQRSKTKMLDQSKPADN
jgi:hypothetical protein